MQCRRSYQVAGELEEVKSLLQDVASCPCITNFCSGTMNRIKAPAGLPIQEVPLGSFFRAINGFGLSSGAPASAARFVEIIKTKKLVNALVEPVGQPERVIVKQLICEDGTRLHFETSARGACCFFIEEPGPSCVEVFDAEHSRDAEGDPGSDDSLGEEVGRGAPSDSEPEQGERGSEPANDVDAPEQSGSASVPSVPETSDIPETSPAGPGDSAPDVRVRATSNPVTNTTRSSQ